MFLLAKQVNYKFSDEEGIESEGEDNVVDNVAVVNDEPAVVSDISDHDSSYEVPAKKSKPATKYVLTQHT